MRSRLIVSIVLAALVLAACGGKTALPMVEYLRAIDGVLGDAQQRSKVASEDRPKWLEDRDFTIKKLSRDIKTLKDTIARLERLEPPPEAAQAHEGLISNSSTLIKVYEDMRRRVSEARTPEEMQAFKDSLPIVEGVEAGKGFRQACERLQTLADRLAPGVDYACDQF